MMVAKPSKVLKTPPTSRGASPSRISNEKAAGSRGTSPARVKNERPAVRRSPAQSPTNTTRRSPSRTTPKKSTPNNYRNRGSSLERQSIRSRGNSPVTREELPQSRGSE